MRRHLLSLDEASLREHYELLPERGGPSLPLGGHLLFLGLHRAAGGGIAAD